MKGAKTSGPFLADEEWVGPLLLRFLLFSLSSLESSNTEVYAPWIRALLGTASQFCEAVILNRELYPLRRTDPELIPP